MMNRPLQATGTTLLNSPSFSCGKNWGEQPQCDEWIQA